jgi:hypothetical protein
VHEGFRGGIDVRVSLRADAGWGDATYDGAWWPRSQDLATELPELVIELSRRGVRVERFAYSLDAWSPVPRKFAVPGRTVRTGGFRSIDPQVVSLTWAGGRRADLLVVPPETDAITGIRALRLCCTHRRLPRSSQQVLATARETPVPLVTVPEQRNRQLAGTMDQGPSTAIPAWVAGASPVPDPGSPPRGAVVVGYPGRTRTPDPSPRLRDEGRRRVAGEPDSRRS